MDEQKNGDNLNSDKVKNTTQNQGGTKEKKKAKIIGLIRQLITLTSLQQIITHNLEREIEKDD